MDKGIKAGGYLTVYMALMTAVLLTLLLTLLEGARIGGARLKSETALRISADSLLAEYVRELFSRYGLLFTDASYGGTASVENVRGRLLYYLNENLDLPARSSEAGSFWRLRTADAEIEGIRFASDSGGRPLLEQIHAYMAAEPAGDTLAGVSALADQWQGLSLDPLQWQQAERDNTEQLRQAYAESESRRSAAAEEEPAPAEQEEAAEPVQDPLPGMAAFRQQPVLRQVLGESGQVSGAAADTELLYTGRAHNAGNRMEADNSHHYEAADPLLADLYLGEKFGSYTTPLPDTVFRYEQEYILYGRNSDAGNLEAAAERLLLVRMASNMTFLFASPGKQAEAAEMAAALSAALLIPECEEIIRYALLFAWGYMESLRDVRTLLVGGGVPLVKKETDWAVPIEAILTPENLAAGDPSAPGLKYPEYLGILLYLEDMTVKTGRTMDLMELNIRQSEGCGGFCMDWCYDLVSVKAAVSGNVGMDFTLAYTVCNN